MSSSTKSISSCSEDDNNVNNQLRRGPWTLQEDNLLIHFISLHGEGRWNLLATRSGLRRTGKSCRLRWLNYLKPDVKRGNLSAHEQLLILDLHSKWGNRWSKIAQHLPGRTDNEIKNYWRTRVQKQARHLNIDTNSEAFQEIIRCYWMPRLLQKMHDSPLPIPTPTPIPIPPEPQEIEVPLPGLVHINGTLNSLKQEDENSGMFNYLTSSCNSSSTTSSSSQVTQISDYPIQNNWNHIGDNGHGMEFLMNSAITSSGTGDFNYPIGQCHLAESNWMDTDFAGYMSNFNMDELWQFRN